MSLYIQKLYLHNYRNLNKVSLEFDPHLNQIVGRNAQGKTNLLEALYFLTTGRAFRTHYLQELAGPLFQGFYLEAHFLKRGIEQTLRISFHDKERRIWHNQTACHSLTQLLGILPASLLTPDDSELIKGSPLLRRDFLDLLLSQADPLYIHHLLRYQRALKQRNELLRCKQTHSLEVWEHEMAVAALYLMKKREQACCRLEELLQEIYHCLDQSFEKITLDYQSHLPQIGSGDVTSLMAFWSQSRSKELIIGHTLSGPHRDDLLIFVNKQIARSFASEGQMRSLVAALRLAQWQQLQEMTSERPLMLVDDLGIGLDGGRREHLMNYLATLGQVFISHPQPSSTHSEGCCYEVDQGHFSILTAS